MAGRTRAKSIPSTDPLERLSNTMRTLQRDAEKLLRQTQGRARSLLDQERRNLFGQARQLRSALQQQARRTTRDLERRADQVREALGAELTKRLRSIVERLELPSRSEMKTLGKRVNELERALKRKPAASSRARRKA